VALKEEAAKRLTGDLWVVEGGSWTLDVLAGGILRFFDFVSS
jgi:hypothetical protein